MRVRIISDSALTQVADGLFEETLDFMAVLVIGGERLWVCDEGAVAEHDGHPIALATIAPLGETGSGKPTIVGVFVHPAHRGRGVGRAVFEAALRRCIERGFAKVHVDSLTKGGFRLTQGLPPELAAALDVNDASKSSFLE